MTEEEKKIDEIDEKLDRTEDYETTINLLYKKVDLLEVIIGKQNKLIQKQQEEIEGKECVIETQAHNEEVLLNVLKKKDKIIDETVGYIATRVWATCPNEDCGANLDCENRCDIGIEEECWKQYFERKRRINNEYRKRQKASTLYM